MNPRTPQSVRQLPDGSLQLFDLTGVAGEIRDGVFIPARANPPKLMKPQTKTRERVHKGEGLLKPERGEYPALLRELFTSRMNLRTMELELNGVPYPEARFNALHIEIEAEQQIRFQKADLQAQLLSDGWQNTFDPVADWLNTLNTERKEVLSDQEWAQIATHCFGLDTAYEGKVLQNFLVALVARAMDPGCKVDFCLILKGGQGLGKGSFFELIGGEWHSSSMGDLSKAKEDLQILHRNWLLEWSEADAAFQGTRQNEKLKSFVTSRVDCFRVPYGRNAEPFPRRSVLCGTTNRNDWASDPTGNRRFPVIEPNHIDREWIAANRERIIGRALVEYRRGTPWWFTAEEEAEISLRSDRYAALDEEVEQVWEFLQGTGARKWWSTRELAQVVLEWPQERCDARNLRGFTRRLTRLSSRCVLQERRSHLPQNPSHGGKATRECFFYDPADHAITHSPF